MSDPAFLKSFFQAVLDRPLEAGSEKYVPLYDEPGGQLEDPVTLLIRAVKYSPGQSIQLLSGFRGTGKTTELKRLEAKLVTEGYKVVYLDMDEYLNMSTPIDISDFLMAVAGAFSDALEAPEHLGEDPKREGYWTRLSAFFTRTKIEMPEAGYVVKANLKTDPTFRQDLQKRMEGHVGALVKDVRKFFQECVDALKARHGDDTQVVLIVDSMEHIRGTFRNAAAVQDSAENLFVAHAERLQLPNVHTIYTVPPYLKIRAMNLGGLYGYGAVQVFPAIKIRHDHGEVHFEGIDALKRVVAKRGDWKRLLGDEALLDDIILMSGGNIRDLLRLLSEVIRRANTLPVDPRVVRAAINQMRMEFLPIAEADAVWLAEIAKTHEARLPVTDRLAELTRFFDSHVVLCYRNDGEWYDVHPLIRDTVITQAEEIAERNKKNEAGEGGERGRG